MGDAEHVNNKCEGGRLRESCANGIRVSKKGRMRKRILRRRKGARKEANKRKRG